MMLTGGALATALAVAAGPADGAATPHDLSATAAAARAQPAGGRAFGGVTPQGWPVVVTLDRARSRVDRAVIGLDMTCTSGDSFGTSDGFQALKLSKKGRFSTTFGPKRIDAGGVPADVESRLVGRRAADRGSMRGVWSLKITLYDAAGATVLDTCESGLVSWTAAQ
jgi:hypothetical protein